MAKENIYKEGAVISFKIKKIISLSENENYFVLEDNNGRKQLLNTDFYKKYKFKIGQNINCKIDHINCVGKIFLEPEHPIYKEGNIFEFTINKISKRKNRLNEDIIDIEFIDKISNKAFCKIGDNKIYNFKIGEKLNCRVELIKKATLFLKYIPDENFENDLEIGTSYKFKIITIEVLSDGFKYYILEDSKKNTHLLRYEYYTKHNLKIGSFIKCNILKFSSEGYYIIEPEHPFYKIGFNYDFKIIEQLKDNITGNYKIKVANIYNQEIKFISKNKFKGEIANCKVIGIKKGKTLIT